MVGMDIILDTYKYKREEAIERIKSYVSQIDLGLLGPGTMIIELKAKIEELKETFEISEDELK